MNQENPQKTNLPNLSSEANLGSAANLQESQSSTTTPQETQVETARFGGELEFGGEPNNYIDPLHPQGVHEWELLQNLGDVAEFFCKYCLTKTEIDYARLALDAGKDAKQGVFNLKE